MTNTGKLELPSINQVQDRGFGDTPWNTSDHSQRALPPSRRLPNLHLPPSYESSDSFDFKRLGVFERPSNSQIAQFANSSVNTTCSGNTTIGLRTPSPSPTSQTSVPIISKESYSECAPPVIHGSSYNQMSNQIPHIMNQQQQYLESQQTPMSASQTFPPQSTTSGGLSQYPTYTHQQPPVLQPGPGNYAPSGHYGQYYPNGLTSPPGTGHTVSSSMAPQMGASLLPLPTMAPGGSSQHTYVGTATGHSPGYSQQTADTSGQVAPSGMKPRVTATLWEDEGCMCFQVEAKGVCVARRDDNHMINGTKLLNVAGMTRGRRDGILKSEKTRHVVKIGPMHLKGVWIPFDRALDFANKEKITESLYPLFVHNIGALLYHPTNQSRTNAVMAAGEKRRLETAQQQTGTPGSRTPGLHHHHSMNSSIGSQQPSIAPHPGAGRPGLDRAHTFPTPPTSASSTTIGLNNQPSSYEWGNQALGGGGSHSLGLESHSHSTPATPATTPPGVPMPGLQHFQNHQIYDGSRSLYSGPSQQTQYASSIPRASFIKQEMGPPSKAEESKSDVYIQGQASEHLAHSASSDAEQEHEPEYAHDGSTSYSTHRSSYGTYQQPEINGTETHPNNSNRIITRNSSGAQQHHQHQQHNQQQQQWPAGSYTPPRAPPSSHLYNAMSDTRGTSNGSSGDHYPSAPLHPYAPTQSNGLTSTKRMREDDDYISRPESRGDDIDALKRRKIGRENSSGGTNLVNGNYDNDTKASLSRPRSMITPRTRVRG